MKSTPALQTERLDLEPVTGGHAKEVWPQLDDDRMWRYFPALRPPTVDALRGLYEKWERGSQTPEQVWWNWLCRDRASSQPIGSMQATVLLNERYSYVAYAVYPLHQRKGYAREAMRAVIARVSDAFGITRFVAEMDAENAPSYRLAESLGFSRVGTRANDFVYELRV